MGLRKQRTSVQSKQGIVKQASSKRQREGQLLLGLRKKLGRAVLNKISLEKKRSLQFWCFLMGCTQWLELCCQSTEESSFFKAGNKIPTWFMFSDVERILIFLLPAMRVWELPLQGCLAPFFYEIFFIFRAKKWTLTSSARTWSFVGKMLDSNTMNAKAGKQTLRRSYQ